MSIAKLGFSGLKYLLGKGGKVVQKTLPKVTNKVTYPQSQVDFLRQTSVYDPNCPDFIHRMF